MIFFLTSEIRQPPLPPCQKMSGFRKPPLPPKGLTSFMEGPQGKMGRNGLPIFKNHTSNNAINVYLLYVLEAQKLHTLRG